MDALREAPSRCTHAAVWLAIVLVEEEVSFTLTAFHPSISFAEHGGVTCSDQTCFAVAVTHIVATSN